MEIKKGDYIYFVYPKRRISPPMKYLGEDSYLTFEGKVVVRKQKKRALKIFARTSDAFQLPTCPALKVLWWVLTNNRKAYLYKWGLIVGYSPVESYILTLYHE